MCAVMRGLTVLRVVLMCCSMKSGPSQWHAGYVLDSHNRISLSRTVSTCVDDQDWVNCTCVDDQDWANCTCVDDQDWANCTCVDDQDWANCTCVDDQDWANCTYVDDQDWANCAHAHSHYRCTFRGVGHATVTTVLTIPLFAPSTP